MTVARALAPALLASALVAAGCGGGNDSNSSSTASQPPASTTATSGSRATGQPAPSGNVVQVTMKNIAFNPKTVTVRVGQTVKWVNEDTVDHNVVAQKGATFKSKNFGQGKSFIYTAKAPATIEYVCTLHPGMGGTLVVAK